MTKKANSRTHQKNWIFFSKEIVLKSKSSNEELKKDFFEKMGFLIRRGVLIRRGALIRRMTVVEKFYLSIFKDYPLLFAKNHLFVKVQKLKF